MNREQNKKTNGQAGSVYRIQIKNSFRLTHIKLVECCTIPNILLSSSEWLQNLKLFGFETGSPNAIQLYNLCGPVHCS